MCHVTHYSKLFNCSQPRLRDWSKSNGSGRSILKCGRKKSHDPPSPFGTEPNDPPLNEDWKLHDPPPINMKFLVDNPTKTCTKKQQKQKKKHNSARAGPKPGWERRRVGRGASNTSDWLIIAGHYCHMMPTGRIDGPQTRSKMPYNKQLINLERSVFMGKCQTSALLHWPRYRPNVRD